jgi:cyclophilin family peptidyl-prolyl cis-trans isomerase
MNGWTRGGSELAADAGGLCVLRLTIFALAVSALVPYGPLGCPPTDTPLDQVWPTTRGSLATTATATPTNATVGQTVALAAQATGATGSVSYSWLQIAGPGVEIRTPNQAAASFAAPSVQADTTVRLLVTSYDEAGNVGRADTSVSVAADPNYGQNTGASVSNRPVANAGAEQSVKPPVEVVLDGSLSIGSGLSYRWRQVSGVTVTLTATDTAQVRFQAPNFDASGTNVLLFELAVTDAGGRTVTDRVQVTIKDPNATNPQVKLSTSKGDITIELYPDKAPKTVANFLRYVDDKFYDNTIFHRVIPNFVIQGGGFTADLTQKTTRDPIVNESNNGLSNVRGTLSMARTSDPNSATSQFFINVADNIRGGNGKSDLDPNGVSADGYAVFGKVIDGLSVADVIVAVPTESRNGMQDIPKETILINTARRVAVTPGG